MPQLRRSIRGPAERGSISREDAREAARTVRAEHGSPSSLAAPGSRSGIRERFLGHFGPGSSTSSTRKGSPGRKHATGAKKGGTRKKATTRKASARKSTSRKSSRR